MVYVTGFRCFRCGRLHKPYEIERLPIPRCECGSAVDAEYDYKSIKKVILRDEFMRTPATHWKYWAFMPVKDLSKCISMGEGSTPLLENKRLSKTGRLLIKYEAVNPTGSFKDRGSALEITKALEFKKKKVALASTGNMGASMAAYAAFAGLKCKVFIPDIVGKEKIMQIKAYGAETILVAGDYSVAMRRAEEFVMSNNDSFLTGDYPWRSEGTKTVGFEIADQLYWHVPDYIVVPVGNGTLIWSIYEAFHELALVGITDKIPRIIGVQVENCAPVADAWENNLKEIIPVKNPKTIATAIACGDPIDGLAALRAIRDSGGFAIKITDNEALLARNLLSCNGIFVEPSGAVAYAGYIKNKLEGTGVCIATGHGLKDMYGLE
ncbi:MAG: threonine synthase [Candidatus Methanoperedens nitroreducens]|uniref:Threonine synthase n=1 Tax=Candidatus Methanoperedens nitratireducens TaxID=1392998 RepID=A0A0P8E2U7_9EURY|nr:threonine synthase [Candidatus Methanoperedens sp. BLZ2]KAB2947135.1 MAG: threonine synthase [Candidatus Methanoperedens sp.]KPQ44689.1 MAG: threonine synthase [Candidatus Methanoperedens sp. BLZ1]MBZ0176937.1 threonine synthase [Candidatus Methanoperedens nitroreducens]MCX9078003.1 threonine synthase [Candidatus Methanoperedens sp.]